MSITTGLPETPATPATPQLRSSPSTESDNTLTTPPSSIRQYSSALQMIMKQGMSAAVADMNDDARASEREFDREFGYGDEDPIERHVRMYLTPRKTAPERLSQLIGVDSVPLLHVEQVPDAKDEPLKPFRPGLIQFHRSNSTSNSAASRATPSLATDSYSGVSAYGDDVATPTSEWSEASFEAVKYEDMLAMYGTSSRSNLFGPDSDLSQIHLGSGPADRTSLMSTSSTATDATLKPTRPSLARPRPRPRTRVSPYPSPIPSPAISIAEEDEWLAGRTVSEQMIAQAGLRCQRGRASRR